MKRVTKHWEVFMTTYSKIIVALGLLAVVAAAGCSTEPQGNDERQKLADDVQRMRDRMFTIDTSLPDFLNKADGYVIFPTVGKGGAGIGGSYGRGQVYEHGVFIGYADVSQGTIGLQLGGQTFTEVVAFESDAALKKFETGTFAFDANASAVAMKSGAAATDKYTDGVAVFVDVQGGLMAEAAIGGQSFTYQPK
jgi:lipid-binding SYLF domain-containing protein